MNTADATERSFLYLNPENGVIMLKKLFTTTTQNAFVVRPFLIILFAMLFLPVSGSLLIIHKDPFVCPKKQSPFFVVDNTLNFT